MSKLASYLEKRKELKRLNRCRQEFLDCIHTKGRRAYRWGEENTVIESREIRSIQGHLTFLKELENKGVHITTESAKIEGTYLFVGDYAYITDVYIVNTKELINLGYVII